MPYKTEWVEPAVAFKVKDKNGKTWPVFVSYKDGEWNSPQEYWFCMDSEYDDPDVESFDIRVVAKACGYVTCSPPNISNQEVLQGAIDADCAVISKKRGPFPSDAGDEYMTVLTIHKERKGD